MRTIYNLITILLIFCSVQVYSQTPSWEYFNSYGNVTGLVETDSTIWVASSGGLVIHHKITGNETYLNKLNSALPHNDLIDIVKDPSGRIWIATSKRGLVMYDGMNWEVYDTTNSLITDNKLYALCCDSLGNVWMAPAHGPITSFDGTTWTQLSNASFGRVHDMACDKFNNIWVGTNDFGLAKYDGTLWEFYDTTNTPMLTNALMIVTADTSGNIWFNDWFRLYKYDGQTISIINFPGIMLNPSTLYFDHSQNLWIGNSANGIIRFDGTNAVVYNTSNSGIISNHITSVIVDQDLKVWAGSYDAGMSCYDGLTWSSFSLTTSLRSRIVSAIGFEENANTVWIGGIKGLSRYDGSNWTNFDTLNSDLPDEYVNDITIDTGDVKVCGTGNGKVAMYNDQNWVVYTLADEVYSVCANDTGTLLAGCSDGFLFQFNGNGWNYLSSYMDMNSIREISPDNNGNFWISTQRTGLWKYDGSNISIFNPSNSGILDTNILCSASDINGNVWIGTKNHGLVKFDNVNWVNYNTKVSHVDFALKLGIKIV